MVAGYFAQMDVKRLFHGTAPPQRIVLYEGETRKMSMSKKCEKKRQMRNKPAETPKILR
jgi:hypothetical protein